VDIIGIALATKPVYVTGELAYRKGECFRKELSVNNASGPIWRLVTVTATGLTTVTGNVFVARTPEVFSYDLDGNMTSDGRWNYTWDAENRLIKVESRPDTPSSSWRRIEWTYDAFGRRIQQVTSIWTNNVWFVVENLKFVSDPMLFGRHIVELNATNNALVRSYVWGLDLSGSLSGAGGVGGLLWVTLHTVSGPAAGTHFAAYDGNGNVVGLVSATTGTETARYEYGPFGEPIRITGPAVTLNPFRFSTKRTDNTTDFVLYEYRIYIPSLGRWPNRDPIGERGGADLYGFVANDPVGTFDLYGLAFGNPIGGKSWQQCVACCCCVDNLTISGGTPYTNIRMGHSFDVSASLSYSPYAAKPGGCSLEWKEKTNVPAFLGVPADQWTDMSAMFPTAATFSPWNNRKQPCPGSENITITDIPWLGINPGRTVTRRLEFEVTVKSSPGCLCAISSKTVKAIQVLVMVNGQPQWGSSSFNVLP